MGAKQSRDSNLRRELIGAHRGIAMNEPETRETSGSKEEGGTAQDDFSSEEPASIWTVVVICIVLALSLAFPLVIFLSNAP